jgi:DNA-binding NtrC family response regulator
VKLLIVGSLSGPLDGAAIIAGAHGAICEHAGTIDDALLCARNCATLQRILCEVGLGIPALIAALDEARPRTPSEGSPLRDGTVPARWVGCTMNEVERALILETLAHTSGNRTHAATLLGISIRSLRNKLRDYATQGVPIPPAQAGSPLG